MEGKTKVAPDNWEQGHQRANVRELVQWPLSISGF
jgi:hypothetical protein